MPQHPETEDAAASAAALKVRVTAVERDVGHIEQQVNAIRDAMATKSDMAAILSRIESLASQQSAAARPNYSLVVSIVGIGMVFLTMLGGFAYWPINTATADLKLAVIAMADRTVLQKQYDVEQRTLNDKIDAIAHAYVGQQRAVRIESDIATLRANSLTNDEFKNMHGDLQSVVAQEKQTSDARFAALMLRITRLEDLFIKAK